jgi:lipoprotein-anchoring transpeptidase ErfK/SrfK
MTRTSAISVLVLICSAIICTSAQRGYASSRKAGQQAKSNAPAALACGNPFAFQVLLDQQSFSPGEIDGRFGSNASHALSALQTARGLEPTGVADCDTWHALGGETSGATTVTYVIDEADVKGPFTKAIPRDLQRQASLPALGYRSALERLAERFHVSPALLQRMNPQVDFTRGAEITVPAVTPFDVDAKPPKEPLEPDVTIQVTREDSALRVLRPDGTVIFFAPVTTGSEHDPLPIGDWKVTSADWRPVFHYNPKLFWDANVKHSKAEIRSGPNNPVGIVWVGLDLEHYGLHGSPEPSRIGHTESHGCVRITNWDAARMASFVKPGTPVLFR